MKAVAKYADEVNINKFSIYFTVYPDVVFVLEDEDGNEVAIATADNLSDIEDAENVDTIEIHNFGVVEERRGYGKALVELLQEKYNLEAHDVLDEAQGFWEKMNVEIVE